MFFASAMLRPPRQPIRIRRGKSAFTYRVILFELRITCARVNNRVTRFRRFPAINGDRLGLTDRLIQSQTSVDARLRRFTFQLSGGGQSR